MKSFYKLSKLSILFVQSVLSLLILSNRVDDLTAIEKSQNRLKFVGYLITLIEYANSEVKSRKDNKDTKK